MLLRDFGDFQMEGSICKAIGIGGFESIKYNDTIAVEE